MHAQRLQQRGQQHQIARGADAGLQLGRLLLPAARAFLGQHGAQRLQHVARALGQQAHVVLVLNAFGGVQVGGGHFLDLGRQAAVQALGAAGGPVGNAALGQLGRPGGLRQRVQPAFQRQQGLPGGWRFQRAEQPGAADAALGGDGGFHGLPLLGAFGVARNVGIGPLRQAFQRGDVQVAHGAQRFQQRAQRGGVGRRVRLAQQRLEQPQRAAPAPPADARLVHQLGTVGLQDAAQVFNQLAQHLAQHALRGGQHGCVFGQIELARAAWRVRGAVQQAPAALGLADGGGQHGQALGNVLGQGEQRVGRALEQFQLDLAQRGALVARAQAAHVQHHLDAAAIVGGEQAQRAGGFGLEAGRQLRQPLAVLVERRPRRALQRDGVELAFVHRGFPFAALAQACGRGAGGFQGLQPARLAAALPQAAQAQRGALLAQVLRGGVEVDVAQLLLHRRQIGQQRQLGHLLAHGARVGAGQGELEFNLGAGGGRRGRRMRPLDGQIGLQRLSIKREQLLKTE